MRATLSRMTLLPADLSLQPLGLCRRGPCPACAYQCLLARFWEHPPLSGTGCTSSSVSGSHLPPRPLPLLPWAPSLAPGNCVGASSRQAALCPITLCLGQALSSVTNGRWELGPGSAATIRCFWRPLQNVCSPELHSCEAVSSHSLKPLCL